MSTQDMQSGTDQLLHHFDDIQPTLLLFPQKLQCIAITDNTPHQRDSVMLRQQLPHGVVELRHGAQAQHTTKWLMVRQTVQPHSKRLDVVVEDTELAMAFELCEEAPSQQQVFAFLPLCRYGLRFIIQVSTQARNCQCDTCPLARVTFLHYLPHASTLLQRRLHC